MNVNLIMLVINVIVLPLLFLAFLFLGQSLGEQGDLFQLRMGLYPCMIAGCVLIGFLYDIPQTGRIILILFFVLFLSFLVELVWIPQFLGDDLAQQFRA